MSAKFNLTAQINLRAPSNLKPVVANIRKQLGSITADVNIKIDNKALKSIDTATNRLSAMNKVLTDVRNNTISVNQSLRDLSSSLTAVKGSASSSASSLSKTSSSVEKVAKNAKVARTEMEEFGRQSALAVRRFLAFSAPTALIFGLTNAITGALKAFINFDKELVRLEQVTGAGASGISSLASEITRLSTSLGVSSESLLTVATTLAQAGLTANETRTALEALAKTELAPSFENLTKTTEGAIAILRQFGLQASDLEAALGSVNAVSAAFAVESGDIIAAIQRTGGVFASASKGVSQGKDALNEFIAVFTSVRQTTRESAETIATGLRTIFTRIQRAKTIEQLKEFGVNLQDLEGKFVGPFEAVKRLSAALNQLDPRDVRFSTIIEELGGFRQIGKVIPLIQQFSVAQQALGVAQKGQSSLTEDQIVAQKSLANQIAKVREQFLALFREVGKSTVFQGFFKIVTGLASGLISLVGAFKPLLPILAVMATIKGISAIGQFASGFFGGFKKGGGSKATGENIGASLSGAKEKERADVTSKAADAIRMNTDAIKSLTSSVQSLDSTIRSRGASTLSGGGKVLGFNRGGVVPGSGKGDKVPAMLEPGEVVMSNQAAQKYGRGNLVSMNKYAWGGKISSLTKYYKSLPDIDKAGYAKILDQKIIDRSIFKEVKPTDLTTEEIVDWRGDGLPRWKKFENLLSNKYNLGQPSNYKFAYLDFPKTRSEAKFMKLGDTYQDPDTLKGNNPGTIAGKNFLFANSKGTNKRPSSLSNIQISETPVTTYWADPSKFDKAALKSGGGLIKKFMAGSPGGVQLGKGRGKPGRRGARDTFKELDETELANLSTEDLIDYAKEQAYRIFSTAGAGMVVGNEFIEVPQERIIPELESELTTYLGKRGFWREIVEPFGSIPKTRASIQRKMDARTLRKMVATAGGVDSSGLENVPMDVLLKYAEQAPRAPKDVLEATIARYQKDPSTKGGFLKRFEQSAKNGEFISGKPLLDEIPDIPERLVAFRKSLEKELSETQDEKLRKSVLDKIVKTNNAIQEAKDYEKDILPTVTGRVSHFAWAMRQAIPESKNFANGGLVQQFMAGSVGGVEVPAGKISQQILDRIQKVGGSGYITANVAYDEVQKAVAQARALVPKVGTSKQLLTLPSLKSLSNGSLLEEIIEPLLSQAEEIKEAELAQQAGQKQLNEQAAAGKGLKFGLASLYGPNGQLGYSSTTNAKELLGKDGSTKYLTQLVRKSLPTRYSDAVSKIQQDIAGLPARGAEQFQYTDIFGAIGPLAFDFDETLVKGADIFDSNGGIDIAGYSDLDRVKEALGRKSAQLTLLGRELAKRLIDYPELMDSVRVLTARPQSNAPLLASKLSSLGLPIPESKITGVSGGLNKVDNLAELETLIDDNLENIAAVKGAGKLGYLYREPQAISAANQSSKRAISAIEGYDLEEIVKLLGVGISSDDANPLRPIDYPDGLGNSSDIWGFDPKMPTDTKRTNDGSAVSRLWAEAQRYIVQNFAFGGKADGPGFEEVKQQIIDKYPEIQFRISKRKRGFGYNLMGALKSAGGLFGDTSLNFQQPTNLKQLQEYSDKLASKLMNPEQLAVGGSPSGESVEEIGSDPLLEKLRKKKESGILGKVGLRSSQSEVTATYLKNSSRSGMVTAKRLGDVFSVGLSNATGGFGPYLYEIVMEKVSQLGSMLTPDRSQVSQDAQGFWQKAFSRSSIRKTPLDPKYWTKNSALLDPKLYGKPETWPPADDPAWILQSGYSKNADFINSSDVIDLNDPKYAAFIKQQQLAFLSRKNGGKSIQLADGGTVPAMVSNGEAYVPPKVAKRIGYAKLDKMNQADRNGMGRFSDGGISVFKGPGSGTSDSIRTNLPVGSYVIREKATKALGLNKGGIVGLRKFFRGGRNKKDAVRAQGEILENVEQAASVFEEILRQIPSQMRDVISSKFKGIKDLEPGDVLTRGAPAFTENTRGLAAVSSTMAAMGLQITGKKGGATTETVAHETGHLADFELGGGKGAASEIEGTFQFELVAKVRKQMEEAFKEAGHSSEYIENYLLQGRELFAEFFAKASPEVRAIITSTTDAKIGMDKLVASLGSTGYTYAGLEAGDIDPSKKKPKRKPRTPKATPVPPPAATPVPPPAATPVPPPAATPVPPPYASCECELLAKILAVLESQNINSQQAVIGPQKELTSSTLANIIDFGKSALSQAGSAATPVPPPAATPVPTTTPPTSSITNIKSAAEAKKRQQELIGQKENLQATSARTKDPVKSAIIDSQIDALSNEITSIDNSLSSFISGIDPLNQQIEAAAQLEREAIEERKRAYKELVESVRKSTADFDSLSPEKQADLIRTERNKDKTKFDTLGASVGSAAKNRKQLEKQREKIYGKATSQEQVSASLVEQKPKPQINAGVLKAEADSYIALKAKKLGMSADQLIESLVKAAKNNASAILETVKAAKTELKTDAIEIGTVLRGLGDSEADKKTEQGLIDQLTQKIQAALPTKSGSESLALAKKVAEDLKNGLTFDQIAQSNSELEEVLTKLISVEEARTAGLRQAAEGMGINATVAETSVGDIVRSAPEDTKISKIIDALGGGFKTTTRTLGLLGAASEALRNSFLDSGKKLSSQTQANFAFFENLAKGVAIAGELNIADNVNYVGRTLEGLGGRFETFGKKLQQYSGAIQTGITVYYALGTAIAAAYKAFNENELKLELDKLGSATSNTELAFKNLEQSSNQTNVAAAKRAMRDEAAAAQSLEARSMINLRDRDRSTARTVAGYEPTGAMAGAFGIPQEEEAKKEFLDYTTRLAEQAEKLGEIRLKSVKDSDIEADMKTANDFNDKLNKLENEKARLARSGADAAKIAAKEEEIRATARAKAEALYKKSQAYATLRESGGKDDDQALAIIYGAQAGTEQEKERRIKLVTRTTGTKEEQDAAIAAAKNVAAAAAENERRQLALANAYKNVSLQTENLIRTYDRASAMLQRFSQDINKIAESAQMTAQSYSGNATVGPIDRTNENVLGNMQAYSLDEVRKAASDTGRLVGGGNEGKTLENQIVAGKLIQDALPDILANVTGAQGSDEVLNQLTKVFQTAGVELPEVVANELRNSLDEQLVGNDQGGSFAALMDSSDILVEVNKQTAAAIKTAQEFQKQYNDALSVAVNMTNEYSKALEQATEYQLQAASIRINAENQLAQVLGRPSDSTSIQVNENRIRTLSEGVIEGGKGSTNADEIFAGLQALIKNQGTERKELQRRSDAFQSTGSNAAKMAVDEQIKKMGQQNVSINNARKALEELANDSSKASNALKNLEAQQRAASGSVDFLERVLTSDAEELDSLNRNMESYTKLISGKATSADVNSLQFRKEAFGGLKDLQGVLPESLMKQMQAKMSRALIEAMPGGKEMLSRSTGALYEEQVYNPETKQMETVTRELTMEQSLNMMAEGKDPVQQQYIDAYREATNNQARAADLLGKSAVQVADTFSTSITEVLTKLQSDLPNILSNAVLAGMTAGTGIEKSQEIKQKFNENRAAVNEKEALDAQQAQKMGIQYPQFTALSQSYDNVQKANEQKNQLEQQAAEAAGFESVEDFRGDAQAYTDFTSSPAYVEAQNRVKSADTAFKDAATKAELDENQARAGIVAYRETNEYKAAQTKVQTTQEALTQARTITPTDVRDQKTTTSEAVPNPVTQTTEAKAEASKKKEDEMAAKSWRDAGGLIAASFLAAIATQLPQLFAKGAAFGAGGAAGAGAAGAGGGLLGRLFGRKKPGAPTSAPDIDSRKPKTGNDVPESLRRRKPVAPDAPDSSVRPRPAPVPEAPARRGKGAVGAVVTGVAALSAGAAYLFGRTAAGKDGSEPVDTPFASPEDVTSFASEAGGEANAIILLLSKIEENTRNCCLNSVGMSASSTSGADATTETPEAKPEPKTITEAVTDSISRELGSAPSAATTALQVGLDSINLANARPSNATAGSSAGGVRSKLTAGAGAFETVVALKDFSESGDITDLLNAGAGALNTAGGLTGNRYAGAAGDTTAAISDFTRLLSGTSLEEGSIIRDLSGAISNSLQAGLQLSPEIVKAISSTAPAVAADAAGATATGGRGLFSLLSKMPGVGALTKGASSAAGYIGTRLGVGGLASAAGGTLGSVGTALGVGKPIFKASGGIGAGVGNFAALTTVMSAITNGLEYISDPDAYKARKQAQSDAGLERAQERTGYGEFVLDSVVGALQGFLDPIGKIVEGRYVAKDYMKDRAAASEAQAKTERMTVSAQQEISKSRDGGAIANLSFDEQRKAMEEAQIKTELQVAQRVQATGGSLGDVAKIFDTTEQSLGATNLQDLIAKREVRLQELPQERISSRTRENGWMGTLGLASNADPTGFADAVAQELQYRLAQLELPVTAAASTSEAATAATPQSIVATPAPAVAVTSAVTPTVTAAATSAPVAVSTPPVPSAVTATPAPVVSALTPAANTALTPPEYNLKNQTWRESQKQIANPQQKQILDKYEQSNFKQRGSVLKEEAKKEGFDTTGSLEDLDARLKALNESGKGDEKSKALAEKTGAFLQEYNNLQKEYARATTDTIQKPEDNLLSSVIKILSDIYNEIKKLTTTQLDNTKNESDIINNILKDKITSDDANNLDFRKQAVQGLQDLQGTLPDDQFKQIQTKVLGNILKATPEGQKQLSDSTGAILSNGQRATLGEVLTPTISAPPAPGTPEAAKLEKQVQTETKSLSQAQSNVAPTPRAAPESAQDRAKRYALGAALPIYKKQVTEGKMSQADYDAKVEKYNQMKTNFEATLTPEQKAKRESARDRAKRYALGAALPVYKKRVADGTMSPEDYDIKQQEYNKLKTNFEATRTPEQKAKRESAERLALANIPTKDRTPDQQKRLESLREKYKQTLSPEKQAQFRENQLRSKGKLRIDEEGSYGNAGLPVGRTPQEEAEFQKILQDKRNKPKTLDPLQQARVDQKKALREQYLSRFRPEVREKMMTDKEKKERDTIEEKKKAEIQAAEQKQKEDAKTTVPAVAVSPETKQDGEKISEDKSTTTYASCECELLAKILAVLEGQNINSQQAVIGPQKELTSSTLANIIDFGKSALGQAGSVVGSAFDFGGTTKPDAAPSMLDNLTNFGTSALGQLGSVVGSAFNFGTPKVDDAFVSAIPKPDMRITRATSDLSEIGTPDPADVLRRLGQSFTAKQNMANIPQHLRATPEEEQKIENLFPAVPHFGKSSPVPAPVSLPASTGPVPLPTNSTSSSANIITIDQASLDGLSNFNKNFDSYVTRLETLEFKPVQHKLDVNVAPLQIQITGAAAFEGLEKNMKEVAGSLVKDAIAKLENKIKDQINPGFKTSDTTGKSSKE